MAKTYVDRTLAREIYLFAINDYTLYRQQGVPIIMNLARKKAKGIFNRRLAIKLYGYWVDNARRRYGGGDMWHGPMVPMNGATKRYLAVLALRHYEEGINDQAKKIVVRRPRKKVAKIGLLGY